ncbi:putative major facilitator superfamily transporter [Phaeomoniella chlamydospora]|uniref:Putative major facilitator superfamily transporter n=1 Tax=Phaeomoniella chlamydospora TaxID=158046 RepID=A0A0G2H7C6_PHACM|nr:putative major facilitator superfamily transporter [Phaeomoniella chlamydospora]
MAVVGPRALHQAHPRLIGHIASEFNALADATWLVTSYGLAQSASQPLYGKLSDIFGRRSNLVVSYSFFIVGCFICGIGNKYWQILAGRAISGIGGAGMTALVSIILTDMVPVRSVAAWRSYVNVAATVGRALGGPVGGWLTDSVGWRWSFYGQCIPTFLGLVLVLWKLPSPAPVTGPDDSEGNEDQETSKFSRIDGIGAVVLAATISFFLLAVDSGTSGKPWPFVVATSLVFLVLLVAFYFVEKRWAKEPVLPIELLAKRDVWSTYLIASLQIAAQFGVFYTVPIYFQIASHKSVTAAGSRLIPAVVGNATGGLLSGYIITKTGRYKHLTTLGSAAACVAYLLLILRWRGHHHPAELVYIFPGGFGSGVIQSTTFIHLAACLDQSEIAIAGTSLYLSQNVGLLVGISLATAVLHAKLRTNLNNDLDGFKHKVDIISRAESSIERIWDLPYAIQRIVVKAYVDSLLYAYAVSLCLAFIALLIGLFIRERKL